MSTQKSPVAPDATLKKLAGDFAFTEGPTADAKGDVYFTDQPNDRIHVWSVDGHLSTFLEPCGRSNGMFFDRKGWLWSCADAQNELWRIDPKTKRHTVMARGTDGKRFNGPNDVWVHPGGGAYFTDPYYQRPYWSRGPKEQSEQVWHLASGSRVPVRVTDDLRQPNGIVGTPDGRTLYVADIGAGQTWAYETRPDGALAGKRLFCSQGSDGMTIDDEGNVYLTGNGVSVYDRSGAKVAQIDVPEGWTANVCFGGAAFDTLFVTASKGLYALKMRVKGVGRPAARP